MIDMGERDWYQRWRAACEYADDQAERLRRGEEINEWAYEKDWKHGEPEPRKIRFTGAAWVARAYEVAADAAMSLMHAEGKQWQAAVDECKHKAEEYKSMPEETNPRDTQFKGFAELLAAEIANTDGWLLSDVEKLIARRAYDLAVHIVESVVYEEDSAWDARHLDISTLKEVADLTEWPKEE